MQNHVIVYVTNKMVKFNLKFISETPMITENNNNFLFISYTAYFPSKNIAQICALTYSILPPPQKEVQEPGAY